MRFSNQRVLVTGASSGIGRQLALGLAREGATVLLTGRNEERLAAVAEEVRALGAPAEVYPADLARPDQIVDLARRAGRVDVLINNAGVAYGGSFARQAPDEIIATVLTNLQGPLLLTRAVLPQMVERRQGRLAFVASISGKTPTGALVAYAASKAGLIAAANALRMEVRSKGISVTTLAMGAVDTPLLAPPETRAGRIVRIFGVLRPEEVAARLITGIARGSREVILPGWTKPLLVLAGAWPGLIDLIYGYIGGRK